MPRLYELNSTIGEFVASEVLFPARSGDLEAFPFDQHDLYSATQPAIFLVDGFTEVYVWLGWWPQQDNKLLREANATTGSQHTNWLRDKKLACETAQHYIKGRCDRQLIFVSQLTAHHYINNFRGLVWQLTTSNVSIHNRQREINFCVLLKIFAID